ncbi:MAG: bifunctional riboflavin kinase/FAD synthetase [Gammaproteobacteria bacterium]|nr:bifunctional riboflavin kinase/FAD synthetase [Gammaproteobacteria bacterium]
MELIRGLHNLRPDHRGCVVTIGNFDGIHLGHQAVITQLHERAQALAVPSLIMFFEPQPAEYFRPQAMPARLMRLREKLLTLREQPIDRVLCVRFDDRVAALDAEVFIEQILRRGLDARYVVVGDDFRFGHKRRGDLDMLVRAGRQHGFDVAAMPTFRIDGERVSSTRIRAALAAGDLTTAAKLLGRPYRMCGRVAHGDKIGRQIGVPTANIALHRRHAAIQGIFAVKTSGLSAKPLAGVASIGTRPTVGGVKPLLEVHLFDFDGEIYGRHIAVDFLHKLRDERRFDSVEEMRAQIMDDIERARDYFVVRG